VATRTEALVHQGRFALAARDIPTLPRRILTWTLWQSAAWLGLAALGLADSAFTPAVAIGLAACTSRPRHLPLAAVVIPLSVVAVAAATAMGLPAWSSAGFCGGVAAAWLLLGRRQAWRLLNTGLAGAALLPLGLLLQLKLSTLLPAAMALPITTLAASLTTALLLVVMAMDWRPIARIPSRRRIMSTLGEAYRQPSLEAWEHDRVVRNMAPDRETHDGLGEVAAWVYRLSLSLQDQDGELELLSKDDIAGRIEEARKAVYATDDAYTRDRRQATLRQLERMEQHAEALALERQRTESLVDYALATLAEARAGLAFSRRGIGAPAPEGIDQVLQRLRNHATAEAARRDTARELEVAGV
jgi:hypothetical protein